MIRAVDLAKRYAGAVALDGVSFEARPGEVLGFLGPNGAGKTTTMRILTGYLPPTRGSVEICGLDLDSDSRRARARIGYLPENVPLYPEMRVDEYLHYRAALKGVPRRERRARVDEAVAQVAIAGERRRVIGQLSKGYRQRVGLADALLHRPEVLILDEPTDGLDPNQRRELLRLVAELGRERTVVLSTHILPEVERVCARVVILDRGRVIAAGRPSELQRPGVDLIVLLRGPRDALAAALAAISGVTRVTRTTAEGELISGSADKEKETPAPADEVAGFRVEADQDVREAVADAVARAGGRLRELRPARAGLDAIFARLTGAARDVA